MPRRPGKEKVHATFVVHVEVDVDKSYEIRKVLAALRHSVELGVQSQINDVIACDVNPNLKGIEALKIVGWVRDWKVKEIYP